MAQIEMQAKALFVQVVITRRWIAGYGGVYVEKLPWVNPNPYLKRDHSGPGQTLCQRKSRHGHEAALAVRAEKEGLYIFHITSLKFMNRENALKDFESAQRN